MRSFGAISNPSGTSNGRLGCATTGASTDVSSIMVSAKLPVKHMPTAPTPGPPHSACASRARARSHIVTVLVAPAPSARNSALTHARRKIFAPSSALGSSPSTPKSDGMKTVKPASRTQRAKRSRCVPMPGSSCRMITAGPPPAAYTVRGMPLRVTVRGAKSANPVCSANDGGVIARNLA